MQVGAELRGQIDKLRESVDERSRRSGGGGGRGVKVDHLHEVVEGGEEGLEGKVLAVQAGLHAGLQNGHDVLQGLDHQRVATAYLVLL